MFLAKRPSLARNFYTSHFKNAAKHDTNTVGSKVTAIKKQDHFKIFNNDSGEEINTTFFWLRDHCRSPESYNSRACQRLFDIRTIKDAAVPLNHHTSDDCLFITWRDGQKSTFPWTFLKEACRTERRWRAYENSVEPKLWDASSLPSQEEVTLDFDELVNTRQTLRDAYIKLQTHGFIMVKNVPTTSNEEGTLRVVNRLAKPYNIGPNYGFGDGLWVLTNEDLEDLSDAAHTPAALEPHTDSTYLLSAPGLLVFHCLKTAQKGGDTLLIDGFMAASKLAKKNPEAYRYLSTTPVEAEYVHSHSEPGDHFYNNECLIKHFPDDPNKPMQIRYNNQDRAPLCMGLEQQREFYQHYPEFVKEIMDPENAYWFTQIPGTMVIINNWRVLHGRSSYVGQRTMTGYYSSQDDVYSRMAVLGL